MQFNSSFIKNQDKASFSVLTIQETNLLTKITSELQQNHQCQKILGEAHKKFQIKQYNIANLSSKKAQQIYNNIKTKFYIEEKMNNTFDQWYDNELRIYVWLLVCFIALQKKNLEDITKKDWMQFSEVFNGKSLFLLQYQARVIKKTNRKNKKWNVEEDNCLQSIIKSLTSFKWSEIAKRLFFETNKKHFRTPKQCRQRWMNHLDPEKSKSKWTLLEDCTLIGHVVAQGKKWASIAKLMQNTRTQHMVKNRYNSLLRSQLKKHEELADELRIVKRLHYRLKYTLENRNADRENSSQQQKSNGVKIQELPIPVLNNGLFNIESNEYKIEDLREVDIIFQKHLFAPCTEINFKEYQHQHNQKQEDQLIDFNLKTNLPDLF